MPSSRVCICLERLEAVEGAVRPALIVVTKVACQRRGVASPFAAVFDTERRIRTNPRMRQFLTIGLWVVGWALSHAQQSKTDYLQSERGDAQHWTGLKWTPEEATLFGGMPRHTEVRQHLLVLRYSFYVSHYDAEKRVPLWVAHVVRSDSSDKARGRTKGTWSRKDDKFTPDSKIALRQVEEAAVRDGRQLRERQPA